MTVFKQARSHLAALTGVVLWLVTLGAQDALPVATTFTVMSDTTAPAIDRGLQVHANARGARTLAETYVTRRDVTGAQYLRGSLVVKFRSGTAPAAEQAILNMIAGRATADLPFASFDIVEIDPEADPETVASRLAAQPDVEYAQARYRVRPLFRPNDPFYSRQWNFPLLDMERAWDINPGAASTIIVAVLDTGVAYTNRLLRFTQSRVRFIDGILFPALGTVDLPFAAAPDLGGADRFVAPRDFIWDTTTPVDMDGHGTHVAGTLGQLTNNGAGAAGMAFNVKIMPVKVVDSFWDLYFGSPFSGTDDVVARGVRYAVDNGAKVLNMSIGRNGSPAPVIQDAINYAVSRGAFVVVAGGNEFTFGNPIERYAEFAPQINGAVAVGAIGRNRARAWYSSTGSYLELVAPGGDATRDFQDAILQQTYDFDLTDTFVDFADGIAPFRPPRFDTFAYVYYEGTSMAVPHVSGLAAMLMQQGITSPAAIEAAMEQFATDLGSPGRDNEYGYGLINPRASLRGMGLAR